MIDPEAIEDPPSYCRLEDIPRTIEHNAQSAASWRIRSGPAPCELFHPSREVTIVDQAIVMRSPNAAKQRELFALVEGGLISGTLPSVGLLFDLLRPEGCLVQLTPAHWRIPQSSTYAPLEEAKTPFEWAMSVRMIRLFPEMEASPVVLPLISEAALAIFLGAENPPPASDIPIVTWPMWRSEFESAVAVHRKSRTRKGGRPTDPHQNKAMWHEVVRRAMTGELASMTLHEVTRAIHEWMAVKFTDPQDETTVRRQLEGLFPMNGKARGGTPQGG